MDATAKEMVWLITNSNNAGRREDAVDTLLAIAGMLDDDSVRRVVQDMGWIISNSNNEERRHLAQRVLIPYKAVQATRR